jgi:hypothetical protein
MNAEVEVDFHVSGYDVRARVVSSGGDEPISGVEFSLYIFEESSESGKGALFAKARSDDGGRAVFTNIPRGCFVLYPSFAAQATFFEFQPTSLQIEVGHGSVVIDNPFRVVGFTVYGRVTHVNGHPIKDVSIYVGEERSAVTDADGFYKIEKMTAGTFNIYAKKEHYYFSNLQQFHVTAKEPALPDITAAAYDICGKISFKSIPSAVRLPAKREILITNEKLETVFPSNELDSSLAYTYCARVPILDTPFAVKPILTPMELAHGVVLQEEVRTVHVTNTPALNLDFAQFVPSVSGKVSCISSHCESVSVILEGPGGLISVFPVESHGYFSLPNILPGTYSISVSESPNLSLWCWQERKQALVIGKSDYNDIFFVQTGYSFHVISDVSATLKVDYESSPQSLALSKGTSQFCLQNPGIYSITAADCYKLEKEVFLYNTSGSFDSDIKIMNGSPTLVFSPVASVLKGKVIVVAPAEGMLIFVNVTSEEDTQTIQLTPVSSGNQAVTYQFSYWSKKGLRKLVITPFSSSTEYLFYPPSLSLPLSDDYVCGMEVPHFSARKGVFIEGRVTPPLSGVSVEIIDKLSKAIVVFLETNSDGSYSTGPLLDTSEYEVFILGCKFSAMLCLILFFRFPFPNLDTIWKLQESPSLISLRNVLHRYL